MRRGALMLFLAFGLVAVSGFAPRDYPGVNTGWPKFQLSSKETPRIPLGQEAARWDLVFADEFEGDQLDTAVWVKCYWWDNEGCTNGSTNEQQWYLPDQIDVGEGVLSLTAEPADVDASDGRRYPFASGMISSGRATNDLTTDPGFAFTYGFVEMRARVPSGDGLWPAFWLLPITHESKPEIDILELLGQEPDEFIAHLHWRNEDGDSRNEGHRWRGPDFSRGFHTYAIEWTPDDVMWFVDGELVWSFHDREVISHEPMYLIANLAVGGEYAGPTDPADFPARFEVDYIRVWQESTP